MHFYLPMGSYVRKWCTWNHIWQQRGLITWMRGSELHSKLALPVVLMSSWNQWIASDRPLIHWRLDAESSEKLDRLIPILHKLAREYKNQGKWFGSYFRYLYYAVPCASSCRPTERRRAFFFLGVLAPLGTKVLGAAVRCPRNNAERYTFTIVCKKIISTLLMRIIAAHYK